MGGDVPPSGASACRKVVRRSGGPLSLAPRTTPGLAGRRPVRRRTAAAIGSTAPLGYRVHARLAPKDEVSRTSTLAPRRNGTPTVPGARLRHPPSGWLTVASTTSDSETATPSTDTESA